MTNEEIKDTIFNSLAQLIADPFIAQYFDEPVMSIPNLKLVVDASEYKIRKAIKELVSEGLVEKKSIGRPARVFYGEIVELMEEAHPPITGWSLTKKALETDKYKEIVEFVNKSLADWANNSYENSLHN